MLILRDSWESEGQASSTLFSSAERFGSEAILECGARAVPRGWCWPKAEPSVCTSPVGNSQGRMREAPALAGLRAPPWWCPPPPSTPLLCVAPAGCQTQSSPSCSGPVPGRESPALLPSLSHLASPCPAPYPNPALRPSSLCPTWIQAALSACSGHLTGPCSVTSPVSKQSLELILPGFDKLSKYCTLN